MPRKGRKTPPMSDAEKPGANYLTVFDTDTSTSGETLLYPRYLSGLHSRLCTRSPDTRLQFEEKGTDPESVP